MTVIFPEIMAQAREDLAGNIAGEFSPEDWDKILARAAGQLEESEKEPREAWLDVIRDFHRRKYWGYVPNYKKPKKPKVKPEDENLGIRFIWYSFGSFLVTKIAVVWLGALYSIEQEPIYKWLFLSAIGLMLANYGYFLYRYGGRKED